MKYIAGFVTGLSIGAVAATVFYVWKALQELDDMDVSPEFSELAQIFNFPTNNNQ